VGGLEPPKPKPSYVPARSTLKLRLDRKIEGSSHMSGRKRVLNDKAEDELVAVIKELAQRGRITT